MGRVVQVRVLAGVLAAALAGASCAGGSSAGSSGAGSPAGVAAASSTDRTTSPVLAAPSSSTTSTTTTTTTTPAPWPLEGRPFTFEQIEVTFVDPSRPTPAGLVTAPAPTRTLPVWLYLPQTPAPSPLIVFSHGLSGHPRKFETLHSAWAAAGFAVAAPVFPLTADTVERSGANAGDIVNQPGDVVFVLDELLSLSADPDSELSGRLDPHRIAAAGLSGGAITTYSVAVGATTRDPRFSAAVVFAGGVGGGFVAAQDLPVLVFHGDEDPLVPVAAGRAAYDTLGRPRYLVVLTGGGHSSPYEDAEDNREPRVPGHEAIVEATTIAFFDHHLLDEGTPGSIIAAADRDGLAEVSHS